jgi:NhaA family Na+:H+ antiporter
MKLTQLFTDFFNSEKAGGILLLLCTAISLVLANSAVQPAYLEFWETDIGGHSLNEWINDGLMAVFFLLIGLELEREIYTGELSNLKKASLPVFAALGGMIFPAAIYMIFNYGYNTQSGAGIPVATDIAFAIGILSLLGSRVPDSLKIFLTAFAAIDDLGSIVLIALVYSGSLQLFYLIAAFGIFALLIIMNRMRVQRLIFYITGGIIMWFFMLNSGIHATLAGVMLAFAIPFGGGTARSPSFILQHRLHKPVAFIILPLFALANTAVTIGGTFLHDVTRVYGIGIIAGLVIGKPAGIFLFSYLAVLFGISRKPEDARWTHILGVGFIGGIGFTMSIFILLLAFTDAAIVNNAKAAVLVGSALAGLTGYVWLRKTLRENHEFSESQ